MTVDVMVQIYNETTQAILLSPPPPEIQKYALPYAGMHEYTIYILFFMPIKDQW